MREEESSHRRRLIELYREKFGDHIPLIRRQDVRGMLTAQIGLADQADAPRFRPRAGGGDGGRDAALSTNTPRRARRMRPYGNCSTIWRRRSGFTRIAPRNSEGQSRRSTKAQEDQANRRLFVLQIVQPGLAGLMDGSVSTLAPVFAAAYATHNARCVSGGSGGIARRGHQHGIRGGALGRWQLDGARAPWVRGGVCGVMTALVESATRCRFCCRTFTPP